MGIEHYINILHNHSLQYLIRVTLQIVVIHTK